MIARTSISTARAARYAIGAVLVLTLLVAGGCVDDAGTPKSSGGSGWLRGLPGAMRGGVDESNLTQLQTVERPDGTPGAGTPGAGTPSPDNETPLVRTNPDGTRTLVVNAIAHVIHHTANACNGIDADLFFDQVLSEETRRHFIEDKQDAREAMRVLREERVDVLRLLARLPQAENSAFTITDNPGRNVMRIRLTGRAALGLRYTEFWVIMERGKWKFFWMA
jgi:hypothetical protein